MVKTKYPAQPRTQSAVGPEARQRRGVVAGGEGHLDHVEPVDWRLQVPADLTHVGDVPLVEIHTKTQQNIVRVPTGPKRK